MTDSSEHVELTSADVARSNREQLSSLFPGVLKDGTLDATALGELLEVPVAASIDFRERYGLQWAGKQQALRGLLKSSTGTLLPDIARSVGFSDARNVFIEGENLEVLKLLQKSYNDKVKLIYIDPPYNTGSDFIYDDDYTDSLRTYLEYSGQIDSDGNRLSANADTSGRRHSRWLSMMYPRLILARNLLAQDGAIFVSIDFNEVHNLRLLMDEVFGEDSFQREVIWRIGWLSGYKTMANNFIRNHDTMLFYSRSPEKLGFVKKYIDNASFKPLVRPDKKVKEKLDSLGLSRTQQDDLIHFINHENRPERYPIEDTWNSNEYDDLNSIAIVSFSGEKISKVLKIDEEYKGQKSIKMLQRVIESMTTGNDIILDFFAGSGSTAHAVLELNAADGGSRRCISVNIPEPLNESSSARPAGYETITDIAIARIKKAIESLDGTATGGLKIYKLGSSHFKRTTPGDELELFPETLLPGPVDWDGVAAEVLLAEGVALDAPWERVEIEGADVVISNKVAVILTCSLTMDLVEHVLRLPIRVAVFMEDGLSESDTIKANALILAKARGITMKAV